MYYSRYRKVKGIITSYMISSGGTRQEIYT